MVGAEEQHKTLNIFSLKVYKSLSFISQYMIALIGYIENLALI